MGSGASKTHEAFTVTPSALSTSTSMVTSDPDGDGSASLLPAPLQAAMAELEQLAAAPVEADPLQPAAAYYELVQSTEHALSVLEDAHTGGFPAELAAAVTVGVKQHSKQFLAQLPPEELQLLAAAEGFEHPTLVGLNTKPGQAHPLVHWLDPAYPSGIPSKLAIQAKAGERYALLAAGETIGGLTFADVRAAEAALGILPTVPAGSWAATPAEIAGSLAELTTIAAAMPSGMTYVGDSQGFGALLKAEQRVVTGHCPEMGAGLEQVKGSAKALVDKQLGVLSPSAKRKIAAELITAAHHDGLVDPDAVRLLSPDEQLAVLRASTSADERAALLGNAETRAGQLAALVDAKAAYDAHPLDTLGAAPTAQAISEVAGHAGTYHAAWKQTAKWSTIVAAPTAVSTITGQFGSYGDLASAHELTQDFRAWAKGQKLGTLKAAAADLGMDTAGASRAHVQNYIAASWDRSFDKSAIQAAVTAAAAKASAKAAKPPATAAPTPPVTPASTSTQPGSQTGAPQGPPAEPAGPAGKPAPVPQPPPPGTFAAKHAEIVEALRAHQAVAAHLPPRWPAAEVVGWQFGPGQQATFSGVHTKTLHEAPDGTMWLFKPDTHCHGALAHAEQAAGEIAHRAGIPAVGVYVKQLNGHVGSIQPLLPGATTVMADPVTWSQADVDAMVRFHVACWAVANHDGHHDNLLRPPSGGMCTIDWGAAFKYFGSDRLDMSFDPHGGYGFASPAYYDAYKAAKHNGLASGVRVRPEAALPTIRGFERIPDAEYRAALTATATEGVKHNVQWVPAMRKAAQQRHGTPHVTDQQVADEFLTQAIDRKRGLRAAFTKFFADLGFAGADKLTKVL